MVAFEADAEGHDGKEETGEQGDRVSLPIGRIEFAPEKQGHAHEATEDGSESSERDAFMQPEGAADEHPRRHGVLQKDGVGGGSQLGGGDEERHHHGIGDRNHPPETAQADGGR